MIAIENVYDAINRISEPYVRQVVGCFNLDRSDEAIQACALDCFAATAQ
jgi:hypothetical protein